MNQTHLAKHALPLVYSCSGCSNAAQMANYLALQLDREGLAEMSCIAGVGGGVAPLVRKARENRPVIALDGCKLHCVKACLTQASVVATVHITLSDYGVKKRQHTDFDLPEAQQQLARLKQLLSTQTSASLTDGGQLASTTIVEIDLG
ncbi:putative zinc-binding protein [Leeia oryzae]|uniref:putative zinc-binding protein n=1 Tax=Leeia oryzae TaxID=356662 RepID=UPI00035E084A|nr:putative zinc-binding protein [Leeia oryzae]